MDRYRPGSARIGCDAELRESKSIAESLGRLNEGLARELAECKLALGKAHEELARGDALVKQILDVSDVAIFLVDTSGRITRANHRMADMFGRSLDSLLGTEYVSLVHPSQRASARARMVALLASGLSSVAHERLYWRTDCTEFWGHLTGRRLFDPNGEERGLVGAIADVTDRRQAQEAAKESERKYSLLFEQASDGIFLQNATGFIDCNEQGAAMYGLAREDVLRCAPADLCPERQSDGRLSRDVAAEAIAAAMRGENRCFEWQALRSDGGLLDVEVHLNRVDLDGEACLLAIVRNIAERKIAENEIKNLAFNDALTLLPNRRLLLDRLQHALASSTRSGKCGALLFIDLDNFKIVNDTLGHEIGDLLLQQVAQRLSDCVREGDTVARFGGDEFVVMLEDLSESLQGAATQAEALGEAILFALNQAYLLAGHAQYSTPSIGVTLFADHHTSVEDLLKRADLAMYQAKAAGRNTLRFFDPEMQAVVTTRAALESDLREAVSKNQFLVYYQAQVEGAGCLAGVEALLRWQHPHRGLVLPCEFISLAEETGLILPLGKWLLDAVCAQLAVWAVRPETERLTISVNVSARQFRHEGFVDQVLAALAQSGAYPHRLRLELTESVLVAEVEVVIAKMAALKAKGVGFSLDDFGTGYSSLSYLKRLPLDQLKIDRGFVKDIRSDPNDAAIARMVIALAESMGLAVLAEGVENEAQKDLLDRLGCHAYQGFLFSRPLPLEDLEEYMKRLAGECRPTCKGYRM